MYDVLTGLGEPVRREHHVELTYDGPGDPRHQLDPLAAGLVVLRFVVAGFGQVLGAHETDPAVDDQDLAVVAQVGAAHLSLERRDGQHRGPADLGGPQPLGELLVARDATRPEVVEQEAHVDATLARPHHRLEEARRGVVPGRDVELHVDEVLRGVDLSGHRVDGALVVGHQLDGVAVRQREGPEPLVEPGEVVDSLRVSDRHRRGTLFALHHREDPGIDFLLPGPALATDAGAAEEQERDDAEIGHGQDEDEPGHRRGGLAVGRQHAEGEDADPDVEEHRCRGQQLGQQSCTVTHQPSSCRLAASNSSSVRAPSRVQGGELGQLVHQVPVVVLRAGGGGRRCRRRHLLLVRRGLGRLLLVAGRPPVDRVGGRGGSPGDHRGPCDRAQESRSPHPSYQHRGQPASAAKAASTSSGATRT